MRKKYIGEKLKWFIDFLPEEVFNSFSKEEKIYYREYRRFQRFIGNSNNKIKSYKEEITKLEKLIKNEELKINGKENQTGWKQKMEFNYFKISHLDKNINPYISIEKRKRSSKSFKKLNGTKNVGNLVFQKKTHNGKELKEYYRIYGRVENPHFRKSIYFGKEKLVRGFLQKIFQEDWETDSFEIVKEELKTIVGQYSRYQIYHNKWEGFTKVSHNLKSIENWIEFCESNNIDRYKW